MRIWSETLVRQAGIAASYWIVVSARQVGTHWKSINKLGFGICVRFYPVATECLNNDTARLQKAYDMVDA